MAVRRRGGHGHVKLLFIGEAPGEFEDALGVPFIGISGKILDQLIKYVPHQFTYVITNIVCCRPMTVVYLDEEIGDDKPLNELTYGEDYEIVDKNRPPQKAEIEACRPHIKEIYDNFQPHGIVRLGNTARLYPCHPTPTLDLIHPSAIARLERKVLTLRKQAVKLEAFVEKLANVPRTTKT